MKKRVLSMLLAFTLCFSTLPMTALAQEADVVTEQRETTPVAAQEGQQSTAPVAQQEEAEAAKPGTAEAPTKSISDSDAGAQNNGKNGETDAAVQAVQALIDALPETVTEENAESVGEQLEAIAEAMETLTEEQIAALDMEHLYAISEAMSAPMTLAESAHTHCICGENHHVVGEHTQESTTEFTQKLWMDNDTLKMENEAVPTSNISNSVLPGTGYVLPAGNYYLESNITLKYPLYFGEDDSEKKVNLCLNGKTITADGDFDAIILYRNNGSEVVFSLTDCKDAGKITHSEGKNGCGVYVFSFFRATFNMYGGSIVNNVGHVTNSNSTTTTDGGGVYMDTAVRINESKYGGIFRMYGGTIKDNRAANGGGVYMCNNVGNIFDMYGGSITGNKATEKGGGVYSAGGTITMTGGSIENNKASQGGGMYESGGSSVDFTMSGGSITGNTATANGGGVYVSADGSFSIFNSVQITNNKKDTADNNVELAAGKTITIKYALAEDASIGVTTAKTPGTGDYSKVASGAEGYSLTEADAKRFFSDVNKDNYTIQCADNKLILTIAGDNSLHHHPICGKECTHKNADGSFKHTDVYWEPASSLDNMQAGYYYLTADVTLTRSWRPADGIVLDLNGHNISMNADNNVIKIDTLATFTLTDCMGENNAYGKITHINNRTGGGIQLCSQGYYSYDNNFVMYGGSITGNTGSYPGVSLEYNSNSKRTFTMYGGEITNNKNTNSSGKGGGVYVAAGNTFTMYGGKITGNTTTTSGGGVYVGYQSSRELGNIIVSGDAQITGNLKEDSGSTSTTADNVYLQSVVDGTQKQAYIQVKGALSGNASISVNAGTIDEGNYKIVAQGVSNYTLTNDDLQRFTSDDAGYTTKLVNNSITFTNGTPHEHPICGKTDCNDGHSNALWIPLTYDATAKTLKYGATEATRAERANPTEHYVYTLPAGNYYLAEDITLEGSISISGDVNICLNGHTISTNKYCFGVFHFKDYKLTVCDCMNKGKISVINTQEGQSVAVQISKSNASFELYGGTISGGRTGVYTNCPVGLYGGTIKDNEQGVYLYQTTLTIGGDAKVIGNTGENVLLQDAQIITINESLTKDAQIGITTSTAPTEDQSVVFATGATNSDLDYSKIFIPDVKNKNYIVSKGEDGKLYLGIHQHNWMYTKDGDATIKVTCSADGCNLGGEFAAYTVTAPENLTYSGNDKKATVKVSDNAVNKGFPSAPDITYGKANGAGSMEGVPKDAGTYWAAIKMGDENAQVTYTIQRKQVTNPTITVTAPVTYNGTEQKPTVVVKDGVNVIPNSEYSVSYENNINAGTATVTITDVAGGNYDVNGSTTFTIEKATYSGTAAKTVNLIKGRSTEQSGTLTAAHFFSEGVPEGAVISACSGSNNITMLDGGLRLDHTTHELTYTSGTYIIGADDQKCTVTISSTNYKDITATLTFHPTDKETVTISGLTYTDKTYDGSAIRPTGTLTVSGGKVLVNELEVMYEGTDGTTYSNSTAPTDAGTYKVIYKVPDSNEDYTGEKEYTFTIFQKMVTADMIGSIDATPYTGNPIMPEPAVKDLGENLIREEDYTFGYDKNIDAGVDTATLTINGRGNYVGTASKTFTITPKDIQNASIILQTDSLVYTGLKQTVQITSVMLDGVILTEADYGIVKQSNEYISANDAITLTIGGKGNYTGTATTTWKITKADPVPGDFDVSPELSIAITYDGTPKTVTAQPKNGVIGMGAVKVYYEGSNGTTYTKSETAPVNAGNYQVTLEVSEGTNYNAAQLVVGTMKIDKATITPQPEDVTEFFEYTRKGKQTIKLAELVPGATGYVLGTLAGDTGVLSEHVTIDAKGLMEFTLPEPDINNVDKKVIVPVTIQSDNYADVTINVIIYISPEYRIIDGAGSSWTQNTTGTVVIRGNGEFVKFRNVKVDGKIIDASYYTAAEGSTIITLKAEYLRTLSSGSHTFAIVWENGIAGTNFTVAANTSGNNNGNSGSNNGGNNSNNHDGNHGSDNSGNNDSGNTVAHTAGNQPAQELDKVPATGDASGIWLALFAVSLSGWAVMIVLRRKSGQKVDPK